MAPGGGSLHFTAATALLLSLMAAVMITASQNEAQTWDEAGHLAAGYGYWKIGDFDFNAEHPPLGNLLSALPLLPLDLRLATEHESWRQRAQPIAGAIFLYRNREPPGLLLLLGRLPTIVLTLILGLILALYTRSHFGPTAGLIALTLFAFDPNFLAHGRYITTDLIAALTIFCASIAWGRFLNTLQWRDALLAGLTLALALASKFSALLLLPVLGLVSIFRWWQLRFRDTRRLAAGSGVALAVALAPALAGNYWQGLTYVAEHAAGNHPAYLLGEISDSGWWYYFPVAFLVKTPTAVLLLTVWCAVSAFRRRLKFRELPVHWVVLATPPLAYLAAAMTSNLNVGIRHVLPVYVFGFVWIAALLPRTSRRSQIALATLLVLLAAESLLVFPHHVAFFNSPSGGPANGQRYLLDSNLDWGQDLKRLAGYLDSTGEERVCLAYFGTADPAYYGIHSLDEPLTRDSNCLAAVSVNLLHGLYVEPGAYNWLREQEPIARIGHSIHVYDLRKP